MASERGLDSSGHTAQNLTGNSPVNNYNVGAEDTANEDYDYEQVSYFAHFGHFDMPAWEMAIKIIVCVVIMFVSLIGNTLVIYVVIKNKRMRTTTNYYIVNLAIADLMVTLCCTWVKVVDDITPIWPLGSFFCKANTFTQVLSMVSSVLTLTVIACDRFFGIVFAMKAHMTERRASVYIVLVWIVAIAVSSPLLHYRVMEQRQWSDFLEVNCQDEWPIVQTVNEAGYPVAAMPSRAAYYTTISLVLFFFPVFIMSIAYSMIIWRLWSSRMPGEHVETEVSVQDKLKKKVVIMLVMILSVFVICWLPYQVIILYSEHRNEQYKLPAWFKHVQFVSIIIGYANSAINPIIYAGFNENFKKGFKDALKCMVCVKDKRRYSAIELRQDSYHSQSLMSQTQVTSVMTKV